VVGWTVRRAARGARAAGSFQAGSSESIDMPGGARFLFALALGAPVAPAAAQAFNVDMGSSAHPVPSPTFGGGANQPGFWNSVDESSLPPVGAFLSDLNGQPTGVGITVTRPTNLGAIGEVVRPDPPGFGADEAALYGDSIVWASAAGGSIRVDVTGLAPGAYDFVCYAGDSLNTGSFYAQECGLSVSCIVFDGTFTQGSVWNRLCCTADPIETRVLAGRCGDPFSYPSINALQIVPRAQACAEVNVPYCTGAGVGPSCPCPCGNCGLPERGCDNSLATGGGRLVATGNSSVSADTLVLRADFLPPMAPAMFLQWTGVAQNGFGAPQGDGLRCVAGTTIRLGNRIASGGNVAFGAGQPGDPLVSVRGTVPAAGGTRYYQVWYRNAATFCSTSTVNLTNGFRVIWSP
jgi:hypothetical protein